jgi:hypothetical protein
LQEQILGSVTHIEADKLATTLLVDPRCSADIGGKSKDTRRGGYEILVERRGRELGTVDARVQLERMGNWVISVGVLVDEHIEGQGVQCTGRRRRAPAGVLAGDPLGRPGQLPDLFPSEGLAFQATFATSIRDGVFEWYWTLASWLR